MGSLLEVGTGFHPELTGRENIFLNGAILGMSRVEIKRKFDEIVAFSGVEQFLDTPVKHYSSGMQVRLAFAVAAHLEPEILIVDEVLAVGDAEFQKKCLGKMSEVACGGRTVFFVSHNMAAIEALCDRALLFAQGQLMEMGETRRVIDQYVGETCQGTYDVELGNHPGRVSWAEPVFRRLRIVDDCGRPLATVGLGEPVTFEVQLEPREPLVNVGVAIHLYNSIGQRVVTFHTDYQYARAIRIARTTVVSCRIPSFRLLPGCYSIVLGLRSASGVTDRIESLLGFDVASRDVYGTGELPPPRDGIFAPDCKWMVDVGAGKPDAVRHCDSIRKQ